VFTNATVASAAIVIIVFFIITLFLQFTIHRSAGGLSHNQHAINTPRTRTLYDGHVTV
jgi:preprotein translocase subunit SecG